jgi:methionine-rich copper-binding protein CopC
MTARRLTLTTALSTVLAGLMVALTTTTAWAHTELIAADPAENATVTTAVSTVTLTFSEPVSQQQTTIEVVGPDGTNYSTGAPRSVDAKVSQDVKPLPTGAIRVRWKTVAADGDPVQGEFGFANAFVAPTPTPAAPAPAATTTAPSEGNATSTFTSDAAPPSGDGGGSALPWIIAGAVIVIAGVAGAVYFRRRRA